MKRKLIILALCLMLILGAALSVTAEEVAVAQDIRKDTTISGTGYDRFHFLFDNNIDSYLGSGSTASIQLENNSGMGSLYLLFNLEYGEYTITDNTTGNEIKAGQYGFLHEYINLEEAFGYCPTSVTLHFGSGMVRLSEIYVFSSGKAPDYVQVWQPPLDGKADILLFATHSDDDQLFFAGLFPYYAKEKGYAVQVAYMTNHRPDTYKRAHEVINGLWATGVTAYPVFGTFDDFRIDSKADTYREYQNRGVTKTELQEYVVTQLRRFKPQVAVGHDVNGEYGHGMHMIYSELVMQGVEIAKDPAQYTDSAEKYGTWDVPKTYLHLYKENPIVIDYDTPLDSWGGLTAFQATQKYGYPCHESQQYTWFTRWLNGNNNEITKASQIKTYNPSELGLFRSTVGEGVPKNDFMEQSISYAEQERLEQERLEQERLEVERKEQERLEQERLEKERLEAERKEQECLEAERKEQERLQQEAERERKEKQTMLLVCFGILSVLIILLIVLIIKLGKNTRRKNPQ